MKTICFSAVRRPSTWRGLAQRLYALQSRPHRGMGWSTLKLGLACLLSLSSTARADLPAPDNLLYGTISLGGQPISAAQTNVIVEARKSLTGPGVSSYRMGSEPAAGNFYVLRVLLEELAPTVSAANSLPGNSVFIVVRDGSGPRATNTWLITERGVVSRLNFGTTPTDDSDGDGLPDAWELARFGNLNANGASLGANGQTLLQNYIAGTDPTNPNDRFSLVINPEVPKAVVSFLARQASGPGYENRSRYYDLEYTTNAVGAPWVGVAGRTNILGVNSTITYPVAEPGSSILYRGRVRLQTP